MRSLIYTDVVAKEAKELVRQMPPERKNRATWTLHSLARDLAARFEHIRTMSHETVRRLLSQQGIVYRKAKEWLRSPDPRYAFIKRRRDRLLAMARTDPDGAAVWLDQSWFARWPYQFRTWVHQKAPLRVAQRWSEKVDTIALYAALDDESQEAFLRWAEGQPNSEETVRFLEMLLAYWTNKGKRFIVLFWDKASWHTSHRTQNWIRDYNRRAKREGLTRLIVCQHPTRSPWLMPLEAIFGWVKHQVLGDRLFETVTALQAAVERYFRQRVAQAKERHDRTQTNTPATTVQKSRSVL